MMGDTNTACKDLGNVMTRVVERCKGSGGLGEWEQGPQARSRHLSVRGIRKNQFCLDHGYGTSIDRLQNLDGCMQ